MLNRFLKKLRESKGAKKAGYILAALFPLITVLLCEINQNNGFESVYNLIFKTPSVLIFDFFVVSFIYFVIIIWVKKVWISALATGLLFYIVSCVEFYRYRSSSVHFTWSDFGVVTNMGDVMEFADIKIFPITVITLILLALCVVFLALLKTQITIKLKRRIIISVCAFLWVVLFTFSSAVSNIVFNIFSVKYSGTNNIFVYDDLYEQDNMVAFLAQNAVITVRRSFIRKPEDYSSETVHKLSNEVNKNYTHGQTPNIIVIMSESYCDFRVYKKLAVSDVYYKNFDAFADEGYQGTAIVSTFGGYTVKSEFELLFGLPIKSLNSTYAPHSLIDSSKEQSTFASYFKTLDYKTTFIHPYTNELYGRGEMYPTCYSFDNVYFEDDLKQDYFHNYIDDSVAFNKAVSQIKSDKKPSYIHITSMQNHMPYTSESGLNQFEYYMRGIKHTDKALGELKTKLEALDEPTIVLFVGDHYPCFTGENSVYNIIGINSDNCTEAYEQSYFIWSNYNLNLSSITYDKLSLFYLPYLMIDKSGLNADDKAALVISQMRSTPIYTLEYDADVENVVLDTLTYDLILGDRYSSNLNSQLD